MARKLRQLMKWMLVLMGDNKQALIKLDQVNKYYQLGDNKFQVLKNISLEIFSGEFVSIMGPSGSGKSTLINVIGFLDNDFEGQYIFQGKLVAGIKDKRISNLRNKEVGFIFQSFNLIESMTVVENVSLPLLYGKLSRKEARIQALAMLDRLGIKEKADNKSYELSGGQKQRVAIARALINQPKFIIADEPTGALDTKTSKVIMEILADLHREFKTTIIMVTHDPSLQQYANKHLVIVDGQIHETGAIEAQDLAERFKQLKELEDED